MTATKAWMPSACSSFTWALTASASSPNVSPATPEGTTMVGVLARVAPMNATFTPFTIFTT